MDTNCPNCGAPVDSRYVRCQYCGTPYDIDRGMIMQLSATMEEIKSTIYTEELYREAVGAIRNLPLTSNEVLTREEVNRRYEAQRFFEYPSDVEEKLTMVNDSLECITDKVQMGYFWGNLLFLLVVMIPIIITSLLTFNL